MVWCHQNDPGDVDDEGNPVRSYGGTARSQEVVVWHPMAYRSQGYGSYAGVPPGYSCGTPSFAVGEHVACQWNPQSGRWEIESPALNLWRVELRDTFMPVQSQVKRGAERRRHGPVADGLSARHASRGRRPRRRPGTQRPAVQRHARLRHLEPGAPAMGVPHRSVQAAGRGDGLPDAIRPRGLGPGEPVVARLPPAAR